MDVEKGLYIAFMKRSTTAQKHIMPINSMENLQKNVRATQAAIIIGLSELKIVIALQNGLKKAPLRGVNCRK